MKTVNFPYLQVSLHINDNREVIGFQELPTVYPCSSSVENHNNLLDKLRGETPRKNLKVLRYDHTCSGKEWHACPELKVWWIQDFA